MAFKCLRPRIVFQELCIPANSACKMLQLYINLSECLEMIAEYHIFITSFPLSLPITVTQLLLKCHSDCNIAFHQIIHFMFTKFK